MPGKRLSPRDLATVQVCAWWNWSCLCRPGSGSPGHLNLGHLNYHPWPKSSNATSWRHHVVLVRQRCLLCRTIHLSHHVAWGWQRDCQGALTKGIGRLAGSDPGNFFWHCQWLLFRMEQMKLAAVSVGGPLPPLVWRCQSGWGFALCAAACVGMPCAFAAFQQGVVFGWEALAECGLQSSPDAPRHQPPICACYSVMHSLTA